VNLLVVEQNLPGMSACEFCDRLRRERRVSRPVLMLAPHQLAASGNEPSCVAADDYVLEPVRASELSARMLGLLARAGLTSDGGALEAMS
jgi:DNA-binding response OmpR family regulator